MNVTINVRHVWIIKLSHLENSFFRKTEYYGSLFQQKNKKMYFPKIMWNILFSKSEELKKLAV